MATGLQVNELVVHRGQTQVGGVQAQLPTLQVPGLVSYRNVRPVESLSQLINTFPVSETHNEQVLSKRNTCRTDFD